VLKNNYHYKNVFNNALDQDHCHRYFICKLFSA